MPVDEKSAAPDEGAKMIAAVSAGLRLISSSFSLTGFRN
jgi:hypothetical protein